MSGGRGFIALAAVILSGWQPSRAALACVGFAALDALQIVLQDQTRAPQYLVQMLPYVAAMVALVAIARRRAGASGGAPAGLGKHAD
jgi:simple sugar transport system permease protein